MPREAAPTGAIAELITRIEANEAEAAAIRKDAEDLGLDAKRIKSIRKAKADADAAKRTYEALLAEGLVPNRAPQSKPEGEQ